MIGLVACCKSKQQGPCPASSLYLSPLFRMSMQYVVGRCEEWAILSAEHGLVLPDQQLVAYDRTLSTLPARVRTRWALEVQRQIEERWGRWACLLVLGGRHYCQATAEFPNASYPLAGMGIGQRLAYLKKEASCRRG